MKPIIKAILWDMDGVLIDSEPLHFETLAEVVRNYGFDYTEKINIPFFGMRDIDTFRKLAEEYPFPKTAEELTDERQQLYIKRLQNDSAVHAMPGVVSLLRFFREEGLRQAIVSSSTKAVIDATCEALHMTPFFDIVVAGDEIKTGKPSPEGYLLAAKKLKCAAENCLVIEDSVNGVKAAKSAGAYCIAVACPMLEQPHRGTEQNPATKADFHVDTLEAFDRANWFSWQ